MLAKLVLFSLLEKRLHFILEAFVAPNTTLLALNFNYRHLIFIFLELVVDDWMKWYKSKMCCLEEWGILLFGIIIKNKLFSSVDKSHLIISKDLQVRFLKGTSQMISSSMIHIRIFWLITISFLKPLFNQECTIVVSKSMNQFLPLEAWDLMVWLKHLFRKYLF